MALGDVEASLLQILLVVMVTNYVMVILHQSFSCS